MWGRKGVTWEVGAELEDIRKAADYGGHLSFTAPDEGAFKLRRTTVEGKEDAVGRRVMEFAAGDTYEGELEAGLKHGQGTYTWGNGARYWIEGILFVCVRVFSLRCALAWLMFLRTFISIRTYGAHHACAKERARFFECIEAPTGARARAHTHTHIHTYTRLLEFSDNFIHMNVKVCFCELQHPASA